MSIERREYVGTAAATTLNGSVTNASTSIVGADLTGYPTGATGPFFIVLARGTSAEEKIKCLSRSANTITVVTAPSSGRGADGTAASSHSSGVALEHCYTADDADKANAHGADTARDDHTQYMATSGTRHDLTARHTFGAALGTPAAATASAVGDVAAAGVNGVPARADHLHGRESFATPALVLGTAAAAGAATTPIRSDSTIVAFDASVPTSSAVGDSAATGVVAKAARRDHAHAREAFAAPVANSPAGNSTGSATTVNHSDHVHQGTGTLANGYAQVTANQTPFTVEADLAGLTVTVTTIAGRRYRITGSAMVLSTIANDQISGFIAEGGTHLKTFGSYVDVNNVPGVLHGSVTIQPSAGSHTYKLTLERTVGTGTVTMQATTTNPAFILIEDIGT